MTSERQKGWGGEHLQIIISLFIKVYFDVCISIISKNQAFLHRVDRFSMDAESIFGISGDISIYLVFIEACSSSRDMPFVSGINIMMKTIADALNAA